MSKYRFEKYSLSWDTNKLKENNRDITRQTISKSYWITPSMETVYFYDFYAPLNTPCIANFSDKTKFEKGESVSLRIYTKKNGDYTRSYDFFYMSGSKSTLSKYLGKGTKIEDIIGQANEYPTNGAKDGYWYIRKEKLFPTISINGQNVGGLKLKDSTGAIKEVSNIVYKDSAGNIRNLK